MAAEMLVPSSQRTLSLAQGAAPVAAADSLAGALIPQSGIQPYGTLADYLLVPVCALVCLVAIHRLKAWRRSVARTQLKARDRIRETDDLTDDLLQGVQGLVLTVHVAAQNITDGHASKVLLDHALSEADELLSHGRRRFERVAFRPHVGEEATPRGSADKLIHAFKSEYLGGRDPQEAARS